MARQGDNHYLVMNDASTEDSGIYMANAANTEGEAKSYSRLAVSKSSSSSEGNSTSVAEQQQQRSTIRALNVENALTASSSGGSRSMAQPPEFKKLFYDTRVQIGENLRLDTVILGSPKPKVNKHI